MPLTVYRDGRRLEPEDISLEVAQPERFTPYQVTMQRTVMDLIAYGRAYWRVVEVSTPDDLGRVWPVNVQHIHAGDVSDEGLDEPTVRLVEDGDVRKSSRNAIGTRTGDVIEFYSPAGAVLANCTTILNGALSLEMAWGSTPTPPCPAWP